MSALFNRFNLIPASVAILVIFGATMQIPEAHSEEIQTSDTPCASSTSMVECSATLAREWLKSRSSPQVATGSDVCLTIREQILTEDAEWYLKNISQFEAIDRLFQDVQVEFRKKIAELQDPNLIVEIEPVPGQKSAPTFGFPQLLNYLQKVKLRNRYENPKEVQQMLNDPFYQRHWELDYSLNQVKSALPMLTRRINQSLKSSLASYQLLLDVEQIPFKLEIRVRINVNGKRIPFSVSMDDFPKAELSWTEAEKWKAVLSHSVQVEGLPAESGARLRARRNLRLSQGSSPTSQQNTSPNDLQNCRISIPLALRRLPFDVSSQTEITPATYQQLNWTELGNLSIPLSTLSMNDRGQVIATGTTADLISYQTRLENEIWTLASVGLARPVSFDTQKLLAVTTNGSVYEAPLQAERPQLSHWKPLMSPYARQLQMTGPQDLWALDLSGKLMRSQAGSEWVLQTQGMVSTFSVWDPSTIFGVRKLRPQEVGMVQGMRFLSLQIMSETISKVSAISPTSALILSESGYIYFVSGTQQEKISNERFVDMASNADGIVCAISASDKKIRCLR